MFSVPSGVGCAMLQTRFADLVGCRLPIQQAGMGGVATPELALAVAAAGGLGMLGGVRIPAPVLGEMLDAMRREAVAAAASRARVVEFFYILLRPDCHPFDRNHLVRK